jgi:VIT1/CCC1 family predicted Fe2+/Mn2+ transporter
VTAIGGSGCGGLGAKVGGAPVWRAAARVTLGGGLAMAATAVIGALVGTTGI